MMSRRLERRREFLHRKISERRENQKRKRLVKGWGYEVA